MGRVRDQFERYWFEEVDPEIEHPFTPLFALGRMPGWIAHYREMLLDPRTKIGRPRQIYVGEVERDYVALADREE